MNVTLGNGESVIRTWDYAKTKKAGRKMDHSLILTNRRIIDVGSGKRDVRRSEIPLVDAKTIEGSAERKKTIWTYFKLFFAIILSCALIGIPFLVSVIKELRYCAFSLRITTRLSEGTPLQLGMEKGLSTGFFARLFGKAFEGKLKVYIDRNVAFSIIDEVSAAIVSAQNGNA